MTDRSTIQNRFADIAALSGSIRRRDISPVEVVDQCLDRIKELNPKLNAFITVLADEAGEQARELEAEIDSGRYRGPLHGVPVGIKDFYDTAGIRTTAAFELFKNRVPEKDASAVRKLKEAGAIIIGKMNMHRLGMGTTGLESAFGPVRNPWNVDYIPGGSSSGSAASIRAGLCYATLDTDAIGSCRLPAACCGVVGFKGTFGLINPKGILEGEQDPGEMIRWFAHPGITTRSVADTALMLDVLSEKSERGATSYFDELGERKNIRIGVVDNFRADFEIARSFECAVDTIQSAGYSVRKVSAPLHECADLSHIEADRKAIAGQLFNDFDVLLLPTTATSVLSVQHASSNPQAVSPENTMFANYYGLPAISVPSGLDSNGLPIALQIVGKPWDEAVVLSLAHEYEAARSN